MLKTKINQKGFAAAETVLVIVIIAIIGGTGYYVYHTNKKSNDTLNSASKIAQNSNQKDANKKSGDQAASEQAKKNAIVAAVKNYWKVQGKQVDNVTVTAIVGDNAKGSYHLAGESASAPFIIHDNNGTWQIVVTGQQKPGKEAGAKYDLPSSWY